MLPTIIEIIIACLCYISFGAVLNASSSPSQRLREKRWGHPKTEVIERNGGLNRDLSSLDVNVIPAPNECEANESQLKLSLHQLHGGEAAKCMDGSEAG